MYAGMEEDLSYLEDSKTITVSQRKIIEGYLQNTQIFFDKKSVLIHNDIADWNTLTDGTNITAIMDWDECVGGDPIMELSAYSLFLENPDELVYPGYEEVKKLGIGKKSLSFLSSAILCPNFIYVRNGLLLTLPIRLRETSSGGLKQCRKCLPIFGFRDTKY